MRSFIRIVLAVVATASAVQSPAQTISTVAGGNAGINVGDSQSATAASLAYPRRIAFDGAGNMLVADTFHHRVRKVSVGSGLVSTIAGDGQCDITGDGGPATSARVCFPVGLALDGAGNIFVSEQGLSVIRRIDATTGVITRVAGTGTAGFSGDNGAATSAMLNLPNSIAFDAAGNLLIADRTNHRIRRIAAGTGIITTIAGTGAAGFSGDGGAATAALINTPRSIAVASNGDVYIADAGNNRVRRVSASTGNIETIAGSGSAASSGDGGAATAAGLAGAADVLLDGSGGYYVLESVGAGRLRHVAGGGLISTIAGSGTAGFSGDGGAAAAATFNSPQDVAADASGNLYVVDSFNHRVRRIASGIVSTVVGGSVGDGRPATQAAISLPGGVAMDASGNMYIADTDHSRVRKVDTGGVISTFAGSGLFSAGGVGDGGPASAAAMTYPVNVVVASNGDVVFVDTDAHRVRRVSQATGLISTIAGTGSCGSSGDGGPATAASLCFPWSLGISPAGDVHIADTSSNRVRKIDRNTGIISTVAGTGTAGFGGDSGPATAALLSGPRGVAFDSAGNLYIGDTGNHRVRRVAAAGGTISTVAGNGTAGSTGDGGAATAASLNQPMGVALDVHGNLFIADNINNKVRRVAAGSGAMRTYAGTGAETPVVDGVPAVGSAIFGPRGIAMASDGGLLIADRLNNRVRKVAVSQPPSNDLNADGRSDVLWRNAANGQVFRLLMNGFTASNGALAYAEPNTAWKIVGDADFNADGVNDLLWRNDSTGQVFVMPFGSNGMPSGGAMVHVEPNMDWKIIHTPDLNGDGRADILWWNSSTGQVYAMLMNGFSATLQNFVYTEPNTAWKVVAVGDFAGSGKQNQMLYRNSTTGQVFLMTVGFSGGGFTQTGQMIYQEPNTAWKIIGAHDFNGDGKSDLLWRNDSTGQVYMMLMNGGAIASQNMIHHEPNLAWKVAAQGDYNGDGKADLLWRNENTGQLYMMLMNGLSIANQAMVYQEGNLDWKVLGPREYGLASGVQ